MVHDDKDLPKTLCKETNLLKNGLEVGLSRGYFLSSKSDIHVGLLIVAVRRLKSELRNNNNSTALTYVCS